VRDLAPGSVERDIAHLPGVVEDAAGPALPYRLDMPARKQPTPQDAATARRILLDGMARDAEISELGGELAPLHPRDNTFPGEVLLQVAADALEWCGASRADPLALERPVAGPARTVVMCRWGIMKP
jgi:hypothetical protein